MTNLKNLLVDSLPALFALVGSILLLSVLNWLLLKKRPEMGNERKLPRQLVMLGITLACLLALIITLPVENDTRNQLLALFGVLLSAVIAFSSTTIVSNSMAGFMLRFTRPFRTGDFIRVGSHFGRVCDRGLFDTEIQTEYRELVALPNAYLISHPIEVVRSSGTIVSANLSLGYDVHHSRIDSLLNAAAEKAGLTEPFVQVIELGNHAVSYRVSGLLTEVKSLLTTRSRLFRQILDTLHENQIEIVSPNFMNQRPLSEQTRVIPQSIIQTPEASKTEAEKIMFDKAEQSEQSELDRKQLLDAISSLEAQLKGADETTKMQLENLLLEKRSQIEALDSKTAKDDK